MKNIIAGAIAALALAVPAFAAEKVMETSPQMKVYPYVWENDHVETERAAIKIYRTVDPETGAICYVTLNGGISCFKEPSLQKKAKKSSGNAINMLVP